MFESIEFLSLLILPEDAQMLNFVKKKYRDRRICLIKACALRHASRLRDCLHPFLKRWTQPSIYFMGARGSGHSMRFSRRETTRVLGKSVADQFFLWSLDNRLNIRHYIARSRMAFSGSLIAIVLIVGAVYAAAGPVQVKMPHSFVCFIIVIVFYYIFFIRL